ncbi:MAG: hypothetical protein J0M18_12290 [Ignavibacteria bacterium]|nr:hypothetical protein [Ignavibacteria bacterium]
MYPGKVFRNENVRKLLSDFAKTLERFLAQEEFEKNIWDKRIYSLRGWRKRNYKDKFFKRLEEFTKQHKKSKQEVDEFYETRTNQISEEYEFHYFSKFDENNEINQQKSDALDYEFIGKKLYLFQYMLSREYVNKNLNYDYKFFKEIESFIKHNQIEIKKSAPELYRSYLCVQFLFNKGDKFILNELKKFIIKKKYFENKISKPYWDYINSCVYMVNQGYPDYYKDIFQFLKLLEENKLIEHSSEIVHYYFKIAIEAALWAKELTWLENFIDNHGNKIKPDFKKDMINLSYAKIFWTKSDFKKSKEYAKKVTFKDYLHYIGSKKILLRISYQENDFDNLIYIADTVKKYFSFHLEIPEVYRSGTEEFIEYLLKLFKLKEKFNLGYEIEFEIEKLKRQIEKDKREVSFKNWLFEKANELKKN